MLNVSQRILVTADAVAVRCPPDAGLQVLLIKRANAPFKGSWALPGGFVEQHEDLPDACARELREETGIEAAVMAQIGAWGNPERDPRGRTLTVAYLAVLRPSAVQARAGDDAAEVEWRPADDLPRLAFDHADIVAAGLRRLAKLAADTHITFGLLNETFSGDDLRGVLASVRGELVTDQETMAFARQARVVKVASEGARQTQAYRCTAADLMMPLR